MKKVGQQSESNVKNHCENEYKGSSLNGECYHLLDEVIVGCN